VYALTIIHHVYGAIVFETPWRHHAAFLGLGGIAATLLLMRGAIRLGTPLLRRAVIVLLLSVTLVLAVALIGLFEGGYNHGLKLALFFGGAARDRMTRLFPPPTYEMPSDVFFEVTGVLQFVAALVTLRASLRLWRGLRTPPPTWIDTRRRRSASADHRDRVRAVRRWPAAPPGDGQIVL
jgi:hypothetical protein